MSIAQFCPVNCCQIKHDFLPLAVSGGLNSKYDNTYECENDVKLPYVLFGGKKKTKVNKPIFKGCPRKIICKYQHFNHIVFSCSACLQKENCLSDKYAIIVRYAVYKE